MKDNFSKQAALYAKYRPAYPEDLFNFIVGHVNQRQNAWDCATGNGQTAKALANHFEKVHATDISQKQIEKAEPAANIYYSVQPAEKTDFENNSFDLVTVSQALHWFATDDFYAEVKRVAKPGSIFAAWSYSLLHITPPIDSIVKYYYKNIIGPYWDPERNYVDEEYKTIPFLFEDIMVPQFNMEYNWTIEEFEGYLNTWSALQKFIQKNEHNPVPALIGQIKPYWTRERMEIRFPLHMRMARIEK